MSLLTYKSMTLPFCCSSAKIGQDCHSMSMTGGLRCPGGFSPKGHMVFSGRRDGSYGIRPFSFHGCDVDCDVVDDLFCRYILCGLQCIHKIGVSSVV